MSDEEILKYIEEYLQNWFKEPGWAEENAGFDEILHMIRECRQK